MPRASYAPVGPLHTLQYLDNYNNLGYYNLVLAHDVVDKEEGYRALFDKLLKASVYKVPFTIMDNSVAELGSAVPLEVIRKAIEIVRADVVILPDVLLDGPATVESCTKAIDEWQQALGDGVKFMAVPQGVTVEEFRACAEALSKLPISMWGVPKNCLNILGSRKPFIEFVHLLKPTWPIHLLGFTDDIVDDMLCANIDYVGGIDSAVPVRMGSFGVEVTLSQANHTPRGDWWDDADLTPQIIRNVDAIRKFLR